MYFDKHEEALFCELVVQLTKRLIELTAWPRIGRPDESNLLGCIIDDHGHSDYQEACYVLERCQVFSSRFKARAFEVRFNGDELRKHVAKKLQSFNTELPWMISQYLSMEGDYEGILKDARTLEAFRVPTDLQKTFKLFQLAGYADCTEHNARWTAKMLPVFGNTEKMKGHTEKEAKAYEDLINFMWTSMPDDFKAVFIEEASAAPSNSQVRPLNHIIREHWYCGRWNSDPILDINGYRMDIKNDAHYWAYALLKVARAM